jgi:hypothetical protein
MLGSVLTLLTGHSAQLMHYLGLAGLSQPGTGSLPPYILQTTLLVGMKVWACGECHLDIVAGEAGSKPHQAARVTGFVHQQISTNRRTHFLRQPTRPHLPPLYPRQHWRLHCLRWDVINFNFGLDSLSISCLIIFSANVQKVLRSPIQLHSPKGYTVMGPAMIIWMPKRGPSVPLLCENVQVKLHYLKLMCAYS